MTETFFEKNVFEVDFDLWHFSLVLVLPINMEEAGL